MKHYLQMSCRASNFIDKAMKALFDPKCEKFLESWNYLEQGYKISFLLLLL